MKNKEDVGNRGRGNIADVWAWEIVANLGNKGAVILQPHVDGEGPLINRRVGVEFNQGINNKF